MKQSASLRPQDIVVLIKIVAINSESWRQVDLAANLELSQSEIAKGLERLAKAGLIQDKRVNRAAALEFILHAIKYIFPAEIGAMAVGVPTATSSPFHRKMVMQPDGDVYVWPSIHGNQRGQVIKPLSAALGSAALKDPEFYAIMSAIEILRVGRARERKLATAYLEKKIKNA